MVARSSLERSDLSGAPLNRKNSLVFIAGITEGTIEVSGLQTKVPVREAEKTFLIF